MIDTPPKATILLVDDDKFLLDMYSMKFSQGSYTVEAGMIPSEVVNTVQKELAKHRA